MNDFLYDLRWIPAKMIAHDDHYKDQPYNAYLNVNNEALTFLQNNTWM